MSLLVPCHILHLWRLAEEGEFLQMEAHAPSPGWIIRLPLSEEERATTTTSIRPLGIREGTLEIVTGTLERQNNLGGERVLPCLRETPLTSSL